jgi:DNA polymerase-4
MWDRKPAGTPLKIGIVFGDLAHERNVSQSLFDADKRMQKLSQAMDAANQRCGRYAVYFGGMHGKGDSLTTRIAFGIVPDLELTDS